MAIRLSWHPASTANHSPDQIGYAPYVKSSSHSSSKTPASRVDTKLTEWRERKSIYSARLAAASLARDLFVVSSMAVPEVSPSTVATYLVLKWSGAMSSDLPFTDVVAQTIETYRSSNFCAPFCGTREDDATLAHILRDHRSSFSTAVTELAQQIDANYTESVADDSVIHCAIGRMNNVVEKHREVCIGPLTMKRFARNLLDGWAVSEDGELSPVSARSSS